MNPKILLYVIDADKLVGSVLDEESVRALASSYMGNYIYFFAEAE